MHMNASSIFSYAPTNLFIHIDTNKRQSRTDMSRICIFRYHHGEWPTGDAHNFGITTSIIAKLCDIYPGLRLEKGFRMILLETKSKVAIELLRNGSHAARTKGFVTASCKKLLSHEWRVEIVHICKEGNMAIDCVRNIRRVFSPALRICKVFVFIGLFI